ncbi:MAG: RNA polymerase sigma factor [Bacteroidota bacterium]
MKDSTENIESILKGCRKGKKKAQEALFRLYADKMFGVCRYYTRDISEAEDVLHDGFLKVFDKIGKFRGDGSLEGWIRRVIVNTALERFRKHRNMFSVSEINEDMADQQGMNVESHISSEELLEIIMELTPQYRLVFNLYALEGYSHQEISKRLGISEGTSKSNLARARTILQKKVLQRYGNELKQQRS